MRKNGSQSTSPRRRAPEQPGSQLGITTEGGDSTPRIPDAVGGLDLAPGIEPIDPGNSGGVGDAESVAGGGGTETGAPTGADSVGWRPAPESYASPAIGTPSISAILAPLKSPENIGEILCILTDTIAQQRGPHWTLDQDAVTAAIGGPLHAWLSEAERSLARKAETIAGPVAIGIGLLSIGLPVILGEWRLYQERKQNGLPPRNPQPKDPNTLKPAPYYPESGTPSNPLETSSLYGATIGLSPVGNPASGEALNPGSTPAGGPDPLG